MIIKPDDNPVYWWAGIASMLPKMTIIPPSGDRVIDTWNELRWRINRPPVFDLPDVSIDKLRETAIPSSTGFGDLLCAWMMPMTISYLMGWELHIPIPHDAGGIKLNPSRPHLSVEDFYTLVNFPPNVKLFQRDKVPEGCNWFCTVEQQWYLNSCMETSYGTIPHWLMNKEITLENYYSSYRKIARSLSPYSPESDNKINNFMVLHIRRGDKGDPKDTNRVLDIIRTLRKSFINWVVVSDEKSTKIEFIEKINQMGGHATDSIQKFAVHEVDSKVELASDFKAMVLASGVVCSVSGGWSAFPYAATRMSGSPLLFTGEYNNSRIWRMLSLYSPVPFEAIYFGLPDVEKFKKCAS